MILLNLIFLRHNINVSSTLNININKQVKIIEEVRHSVKSSPFLAYAIQDIDYLSVARQELANHQLVQKNIWENFLGYFWQQKVFLSIADKSSDQYAATLNALNIKSGRTHYKQLLLRFSKSLLNRSTPSFFMSNVFPETDSINNIEYLWQQNWWPNLFNWFSIWQLNKPERYISKLYEILENNLFINRMPLYVVSNQLGQMVISENPKLSKTRGSTYNQFLSKDVHHNLKEAWFFVSFEDAREYMQYINKCYNLPSSSTLLKVFVSDLKTFYKLSKDYNHKVVFRLVPDLNEVGNLIYKYKKYQNIKFYNKQKYGRVYFQGQPLYILQNKGKQSNVDIYDYFKQNNHAQSVIPIFTHYETAIDVMGKIQKKSSKKLSFYFTVYNLENFLRDNINFTQQKQKVFLIIPSKNSYKYIKDNELDAVKSFMSYNIYNKLFTIKLWTKRVLWSLTSKKVTDY